MSIGKEIRYAKEWTQIYNECKEDFIEKASEWFSDHITDFASYDEEDGWNIRHKEMHDAFRKAMET